MTKNEADRRVQRTRRLLQDACVELILEKGYSAVTVQDILDRADVGRSTFYAHYRDKDELLESCFDSLFAAFDEHTKQLQLNATVNTPDGGANVNLPLIVLKSVEQEHGLFQALLGKKSGGVCLTRAREHLLKYTRSILKSLPNSQLSGYQLEAVAHYVVDSLLALVVWWVDSDLPCSVDELSTLMMRLIEPGLMDVLEVSSLWSSPIGTTKG